MGNNPSGEKGSRFERLMADHIGLWVPGTDRKVKEGRFDKGDLIIPGEWRFLFECKNERKMDLSGGLRESQVEAGNFGVPIGALLHKRPRVGDPGRQYAILEVDHLLSLAYPDNPLSVLN